MVVLLSAIDYMFVFPAADHPYKDILTSLPKPGGGEFGKYYNLPALNDPRIGNISILFHYL